MGFWLWQLAYFEEFKGRRHIGTAPVIATAPLHLNGRFSLGEGGAIWRLAE